MRHGRFGGVFLADLPLGRLKRVRAARAMISPARREKACTSTGAGGVIRIERQWLIATLHIGRIGLLRLFHRTNSFQPRNAVDHIPFRTKGDAWRTGRSCGVPAHCGVPDAGGYPHQPVFATAGRIILRGSAVWSELEDRRFSSAKPGGYRRVLPVKQQSSRALASSGPQITLAFAVPEINEPE